MAKFAKKTTLGDKLVAGGAGGTARAPMGVSIYQDGKAGQVTS